jgi:hypothetical protein
VVPVPLVEAEVPEALEPPLAPDAPLAPDEPPELNANGPPSAASPMALLVAEANPKVLRTSRPPLVAPPLVPPLAPPLVPPLAEPPELLPPPLLLPPAAMALLPIPIARVAAKSRGADFLKMFM